MNERNEMPVADRLDIAERLHRYSWASDERDWDALAACFTKDATFTLEAAGRRTVTQGRPAIVEMVRERHRLHFEAREKRRHTTSGLVIEVPGTDSATAVSYVCVVVAQNSVIRIASSGRYRDELRKSDGTWLIHRRFVQVDIATG
jgi:3-phenylpropionate/cinnamic acid dioxygenase small subunit